MATVPLIDVTNYDAGDLVRHLISDGYVVLENWPSLLNNPRLFDPTKVSSFMEDDSVPEISRLSSDGDLHVTVENSVSGHSGAKKENAQIDLSSFGQQPKTDVPSFFKNELNDVGNVAVSMISKALELGYNHFNTYLSEGTLHVSRGGDHANWSFLSLHYVTGQCGVVASTTNLNTETHPVINADVQTPKLVLSVGKIFETITEGLFFSNVHRIHSINAAKSNCVTVSKILNTNLNIGNLIKEISRAVSGARTNYSKLIKARIWQLNYLKDPTIGPNPFSLTAANTSISSSKEKAYNILNDINTGKEHMFGYLQNNLEYLGLSGTPQLNYIRFDLLSCPYLICFLLDRSVGEMLFFDLICLLKAKSGGVIEKETGFIISQYYDNFIRDALTRYRNFQSGTLNVHLQFLTRVFFNLDNIIYIHFLSHTNLPSLNDKFIPNLQKILGKEVTVVDILQIKVLFPESYELYKKAGLFDDAGSDGNTDLLIGLAEEQLRTTNFAKEIAVRKRIFTEAIEKFTRNSSASLKVLEKAANDLFFKLTPVATSKTKIDEINSASAVSGKNGLTREGLVEGKGENNISTRKVTTTTPPVRKATILKITKLTKQTSSTSQNNKLTLLERIRLKEADRKKKISSQSLQPPITSGNTSDNAMNTAESSVSSNRDELLMIFEILYSLNSSDRMKSFTAQLLINKIIDSLNSKSSVAGPETVLRNLRTMDRLLPDGIFQLVHLNSGKGGQDSKNGNGQSKLTVRYRGMMVVKYNFFNKREEVMKLLNS